MHTTSPLISGAWSGLSGSSDAYRLGTGRSKGGMDVPGGRMAVEASLAHSWSGACGSKFRLARVDRRRQRSLRRNFENAPAGLWRTKGRIWDPAP